MFQMLIGCLPLHLHQPSIYHLTTAYSQYGYKYFIVWCHSRLIISQLLLWVDCVLHPSLGWVRKVFVRKLRSALRGGLAVGPKNIECWRGSGRLILWNWGATEQTAHLAVGISVGRRAKGWNYAPRKHLARVRKKCNAIIKRHNKND